MNNTSAERINYSELHSGLHSAPRGNSSVLVVDDEPGMRTALQANFLRHGWRVETASGVRDAKRVLDRGNFDLVVSDVRMQDGDGMEVMCSVRASSPQTAVILLTAFGSVPEAVESMRSGAFDYLTKPVSFEQLQAAAARVMERVRVQETQNGETKSADRLPTRIVTSATTAAGDIVQRDAGIVGRSPLLLQSLQRARAAASTNADVLVEAESGAGKELLAKFIHEASDRSRKPFVAVNCAAVPEHLLESELFGHAKGAFTGATTAKAGRFELADGGTLLLDEIGEMPLNLQPKLLRVLQEREFERLGETRSIHVDIRVIATTNASLASMVEQARFRSDLYYRLNVIPLSIPALRDRADDIPLLARHFAERFAAAANSPLPLLDPSFLERLQGHNWPGNVRELGNFMRRVLSLHQGAVIDADCFDEEFHPLGKIQFALNHILAATPASMAAAHDIHAAPSDSGRAIVRGHRAPSAFPAHTAGTPIRDLERMHLESTLALAHGNRTHAAEMLGISLRTVRNKIKEYGLPPRSYA
jgi:DNA-binding NtrC family response regulator